MRKRHQQDCFLLVLLCVCFRRDWARRIFDCDPRTSVMTDTRESNYSDIFTQKRKRRKDEQVTYYILCAVTSARTSITTQKRLSFERRLAQWLENCQDSVVNIVLLALTLRLTPLAKHFADLAGSIGSSVVIACWLLPGATSCCRIPIPLAGTTRSFDKVTPCFAISIHSISIPILSSISPYCCCTEYIRYNLPSGPKRE